MEATSSAVFLPLRKAMEILCRAFVRQGALSAAALRAAVIKGAATVFPRNSARMARPVIELSGFIPVFLILLFDVH